MNHLAFLDIEKVIEHRPLLDKMGSQKRQASPQRKICYPFQLYFFSPDSNTCEVTLDGYNKHWVPTFSPLRCSSCNNPIRGSMFYRVGKNPASENSECLCEACYRSYHYGESSYVKAYKHCILDKSISLEARRRICRCPYVNHFDETGKPCDIFPVSEGDKHIGVTGPSGLQCGLLQLGDHIAEAKYDGMEGKIFQQKQPQKLADMKRRDFKTQAKKKQKEEREERARRAKRNWKPPTGSATEIKEEGEQEDIPLFLRGHAEKYPFANVHMALRLGPLVIENGVAQ